MNIFQLQYISNTAWDIHTEEKKITTPIYCLFEIQALIAIQYFCQL